jgi:Flp pilus assembly protein TadD
MALASSTAAWPFGDAKATPPPAAAPAAPAPPKPADAPAGAQKASADERAKVERLDPMTRVAFWTRETNVDPSDAEAGVGLAGALRALGRFDEAADAAGRVLGLHPKYRPALFELARAQISAGKGFYAIKPLQDAAAMDPHDVKAFALLGVAYEQNEQPELARAAYVQAISLAPDNPTALTNYALFRATHGEPGAAEAMLRRAVAQPTAGPSERQNLALVLGLEGKLTEAEALIRQDLPPEAANNNLAYLRTLNAAKPTGAPGSSRSWSSVQAAEAAQAKAPS